MAWIEVHQSLWDHRKTMQAAETLGLPDLYLAAHLVALWTWSIDNAPDGTLPESYRIVAKGARWTDDPELFVGALIDAGWLDRDADGRLVIHDFDAYIGKLTAQRQRNAERQQAWRNRQKDKPGGKPKPESESDVTVTSPSRNGATVQNTTGHNRETESDDSDAGASPSPATEPVPPKSVPYALFQVFCEERQIAEADVPAKDKSRQLGIAKRLTDYGEADVRGCIRFLASQSWRTAPWDLRTVETEIGKWIMAGRPASEPARASPAHGLTISNGHGPRGPDAAYFAARAKELERQGL